jgi:rRNA-processing protein FCF1
MEKIVLDTSVLLSIFELKIDLFEEIKKACDFRYELFIVEGTLEELERLINGLLLSKRQAAVFAEKLLQARHVKVLETENNGSVDDQLVDLDGYIVATADRELKRRLKAKGTRILTIRQKKYVMLE